MKNILSKKSTIYFEFKLLARKILFKLVQIYIFVKKSIKMKANWEDRIISDESVLIGKPIIKGTRISVDHIIGLLAQGWHEQQILDNYPRITQQDLQAVFAYIYDCFHDGLLMTTPKKSA